MTGPAGAPVPAIGDQAVDSDGTVLGTVAQVWLADATGEPTWIAVADGTPAATTSLAPAAGATRTEAGRVQLAFPASRVLSAPRWAEDSHLSPDQEAALIAHFWPATDGAAAAMVRSEEQLRVTVETVPYARAALRVETITEQVMVPVTVTRQTARIEYLAPPAQALPTDDAPTDDVPTDDAPAAPTDGELPWVTLYADEPVVTTRRVPVERVRLDVHRVDGAHDVTGPLAREVVDVDRTTATDHRPPVAPTR